MSDLTIGILELTDPLYPEKLKKSVKDARNLRYLGSPDTSSFLNCVGFVGSRRMTPYGERVVGRIIGELNPRITIVSGFTRGVDLKSHETSLRHGMKTIAIVPCGLKSSYLKRHYSAVTDIVQNGGLVISEYEEDFEPKNWSFVKRNRLVAGITDALVVVEAGEGSGSLITAEFSKKYSRQVFSIPGSIFSDLSAGTNRLIHEGARLLSSGREINNCLGLCQPCTDMHLSAGSGASVSDKGITINTIGGGGLLSEDSAKILKLLNAATLSSTEISYLTGMTVGAVNICLTDLLMGGNVASINGEYYVSQS